jgi:hypothetical protein
MMGVLSRVLSMVLMISVLSHSEGSVG